MNTFAKRLCAALDATREYPSVLARATSISPARINAFLHERAEATAEEALEIAAFLGCDRTWLLHGAAKHRGVQRLLVRELELASVDAVGGVVTLKPDDYARIYALACMGSE